MYTPHDGHPRGQTGFTIVELLIVIVIIGILAAITIVAYNGIQTRAQSAALQADMTSVSKKMKLFQVDYGSYPTTISCSQPDSSTNLCLKASSPGGFQYVAGTGATQTFCVSETNGTESYSTRQNGLILAGNCPLVYLDASDGSSYPGTGTTWTDLSGYGNNGTLNGAVGFSSANGGSLTFDGSSSYVSSTTPNNYLDATIVFQPDFTLASGSNLVGLLASGTSNDESLRFTNANGTGPWTIPNPGNANDWANSSTSYMVNGSITNTLKSGWNIISGIRTNLTSFAPNFSYYLGSGYPGRYYRGKIAAVILYNQRLSDADHTQIFNALRGKYGL